MDTENSSRMRQVMTGLVKQKDDAAIQLDAIFRAFSDILLVLDRHGVILEYRAGDTNLLYLPPEQFLGKRIQDVMPAEVGEKFDKAIGSAGKPDEITIVKYVLTLPHQGKRWFEAHLVFHPAASIIAIIRDVTDHEETTERVRQQLRQISALHAIDVAITSSFDLKVTLAVILREIQNQLAVDAADVLLFNQNTHMLEFAGGQGFLNVGFQHTPVRIGQGYAGTAALERRTITASEFDAHSPSILTDQELKAEGFVSYYAVPLMVKGLVRGVLEIYHRSPLKPTEPWLEFLAALASRAALAIDSAELFQNLQQTNLELSLAYDSTINGWSQALEISGRESSDHIRNVLDLTIRLAQRMGISERDQAHIQRGVQLHDIGTLGIPELLLLKPAQLTESEWAIIREHPRLSVQMLHSIPFLAPALDIPHSHHERWDGSGYPEGLQGEKIPIAARIFAVVDVYDALVSSRPYRPAWTPREALQYIQDQAGKLFDPKVASTFMDMMKSLTPPGRKI